MSTTGKLELKLTPGEYASWERQQPQRHEYYAGDVFAQAGGTRRHSLIGANVLGEIRHMLKGKPCQAHGSDLRVLIEPTGYQAYPHVSVACPPLGSATEEVVTEPILLVEVLSPSTADFDRGCKFGHYRQIKSLLEYLVFWQDEPRVEQHTRTGQGLWLQREIVGIDQTIQLASLSQTLHLRDAYDKLDFNSPN